MPRGPRVQIAGGFFHVTTRGNRRQPIYHDEIDRERFLGLLELVVKRLGWRCHAYCLMGNHYHCLVETPEKNLSTGMHLLNGIYAQWSNGRYDVEGHLFERRFYSVVIQSSYQLLATVRYLALNPVEAGLCRTPQEWPWSSFRQAIGLQPRRRLLTLSTVLEQFAPSRLAAMSALRDFVLGETELGLRG
ncbi:MAG: transposase [Gaiellaceae bacterium]